MVVATKFEDKSARVVLVETSASVRQLFSEVFKTLGFSQAQCVASLADAHHLIETESVDWLVVPLNAGQDINGLHTVRMVTSFTELKDTKVSLLIDATENWVLSKAFEFGLLSYHQKPSSKESVTADFENFLKIFAGNQWDATKTSATYLRKHLRSIKQTVDLLSLEKNLLDLHPGETELLVNLAEALHLNNQNDSAKKILRQVEFIDPSKKELIQKKLSELFGVESTHQLGNHEDNSSIPNHNLLGLRSIVQIDHDDANRLTVRSILTELGCDNIHDFSDGASADAWMDANPEPDLVIMEWKIPKLSGPIMLQRIRSKGFANVPIIILSSLIKPSDMPIIKELGVSNLIQKPLDRTNFLKALIWTIQQERMPTEFQTLENKIRAHLTLKNFPAAEELLVRYINDLSINSGRKTVLQAELAFAKENYELARDLAIDAIKQSGESLFAINILGKSLMFLRQYEPALKCFQKAQAISPMNLERLLMIAETHAEVGHQAEAQESLNKAKDIDPNSAVVTEGAAKVAVASGSLHEAKALFSTLESTGSLIRYLNNKAVAHAKCGYPNEGIEIYEKTLSAIPSDQSDIVAIVSYNMALAKIRKGDLMPALADLEAVLVSKESRVHKKALSLKARLEPTVQDKSTFTLRESDRSLGPTPDTKVAPDDTSSSQVTSGSLINVILDMAPGDHCCYLLFKSSAEDPPELTKILATPPKFTARKTIERGETFSGSDSIKVAG